jgi:hypothetical protein
MGKRTTITIETSSLLILSSRSTVRSWCPKCAAEQQMIAFENTGERALEQWLNSGELHRSQTDGGSWLICLNSLLACVQNTKKEKR